MRLRFADCSMGIAVFGSRVEASSHLMTRILRGSLGLVGLAWICFASTLCGCNSVNGYVMNESGKAYYRRGDYTAARHEFERALMDSPENPNYAYNVAAAMQQQGDAMAAEKMYQHALVIDPGHEPSYEGLAHLLNNNGRTTEAEQLLTAWAETQPYEPNSNLALARMYENTGNLDAADLSMERALAANPGNMRLNDEIGGHYRRAGRRRHSSRQGMGADPYSSMDAGSAGMMAQSSGMSPALLMAQQMPQYDPTFLPAPAPYTFLPQTPSVPAAPYIGSSNLASQGAPSIYQHAVPMGTQGVVAQPPQWGTPAAVPAPAAIRPGSSMMASQPAYGPSAPFFSGGPMVGQMMPMQGQPMMVQPSMPAQVMPAAAAMPAMQPMMMQPVSGGAYGTTPVVPAF